MDVNIEEISGVWDLGYSLDKHTISSTPIGYNETGHMQFDTVRPEVGEALFQLKYRSDYGQVPIIARQLYDSLDSFFPSVGVVVPMPASKTRSRQPVTEIAREYARLKEVPCLDNLLVKNNTTPAMKDIGSRDKRVSTLMGAFSVHDVLNAGYYDVLIVDDLFDTGSSLEAATNVLNGYNKVRNVYVMTVTRTR